MEGPTLADRIAQGPIPVDEALPIAKQIAEALEAAHEAGVIHRDLKPANIKVREDGTVKVLDFGLAKALDPNPAGDPSQSPTLTAAATQMGVIMGTAAYMAPEQAKGKVADKRADVWAFGVVVYEMLTGRRTFEGGDVSEVMAKVITSEPGWDALPSALPPAVRTYLRRCLQKDPRKRIRDIGDVRLAMEGAFDVPAPPPVESRDLVDVAPRLQIWQRPVAILGIVVIAVLVTGLATWTMKQLEVPGVVRFAVSADEAVALHLAASSPDVAISPNGEHIAYLTRSVGLGAERLHVRPLDQFTSETLVAEGELNSPFFSADGLSVGFYDRSPPVLLRVSVQGGLCRPSATCLGGTCEVRAGALTARSSSPQQGVLRGSGGCRLLGVSRNS